MIEPIYSMESLLSRSEPKALSSRSALRLFIGSFFLFWTLNPRSQGTMPTGMIRVRKSEQLDYPCEEGRWREASQFPRLDAWIICHLVMDPYYTMKGIWPFTVKKCRHSLDYWIIVPKIIVTHHSGNKCDSKQTRCLRHIWKQHENHLRRSPSRNFVRFPRQAARISFE